MCAGGDFRWASDLPRTTFLDHQRDFAKKYPFGRSISSLPSDIQAVIDRRSDCSDLSSPVFWKLKPEKKEAPIVFWKPKPENKEDSSNPILDRMKSEVAWERRLRSWMMEQAEECKKRGLLF